MEKLIELFKDYVDNYGTDTKDIEREYGVIDDGQGFQYGTREYLYEIIVSKKFLFIKWLVENEKIDYEKVRSGEGNGSRWHFETVQPEYYIIMLLSIQDEPINFLISILK